MFRRLRMAIGVLGSGLLLAIAGGASYRAF